MITTTQGDKPLLPTPRLLATSRLFDGTEWPSGSSVPIASWRGALPEGVTVAFELTEPGQRPDAAENDALRRGFEFRAYRPPGKGLADVEVALFLTDWADDAPASSPEALSLDAPGPGSATRRPNVRPQSLQRECVLLAPPADVAGARVLTVAVPLRLGPANGGTQAAVARVRITPPDDTPEHLAASDACAADLLRQSRDAEPRRSTTAPVEWSGLEHALATFQADPDRRRSALLYLSSQAAASSCADLALLGDDSHLAGLADETARRLAARPAPINPLELGWLLDQTCLDFLASAQSAGGLPPELASILTRVGGEAGRHPDSLTEILRASASHDDLNVRLIAENRLYLEEIDPSARVRAYDWLDARGLAPGGYDPLADRRTRRAALEWAATQPTTGGAP